MVFGKTELFGAKCEILMDDFRLKAKISKYYFVVIRWENGLGGSGG
jgi:hypothetical protein